MSIIGFSSVGMTIWLGEFVAEVVIYLLLAYPWARSLRRLAGATALMDVVKFLIRNDQSAYAHLWGFWRIAEVCWLVWIATDLLCLLVPRLKSSSLCRGPYAIVLAAAVVNGPPTLMTDFYAFQRFGLFIAVATVAYAVLTSTVERFEDPAIATALLAVLQCAAGEVALRLGYAPIVAQLCWLAGLAFVIHTMFTYQPPCVRWPVKMDTPT